MSDDRPLMKCGHLANGRTRVGDEQVRCCVGCTMAGDPASREVDDGPPPDLTGRTARCTYYGSVPTGRNHESYYGCKRGDRCLCEQPSSLTLPFFDRRRNDPHDRFFCGCWGWD